MAGYPLNSSAQQCSRFAAAHHMHPSATSLMPLQLTGWQASVILNLHHHVLPASLLAILHMLRQGFSKSLPACV